MHVALVAAAIVVALLVACKGREPAEAPATPLPTRQTTIDPVTKKLETAREEAERRRKQVDEAAK